MEEVANARSKSVPQVLTSKQLLHVNVQRVRGGLVFKAKRLLYHSTVGLTVMKQKKKSRPTM